MSSSAAIERQAPIQVEPGPALGRSARAEVVIRARDLGKCYHIYDRPQDRLKQALLRWKRRYYREFWALRGVDLEVRRGEAVGVVGRNGSGKSTLLQLVAGTLAPTTGEVAVAGRVAALLELGSGFNPEFTGRENVHLNAAILGLSRKDVDEKFDAIAAFADIGEFLEQPVKTYSSGMLVRLAFAVQVQVEPDVLIVDEALAVGDALFQKRCYQRIEELRSDGVTLLFVSHDQESVRTLTTRAILLEQGQPLARGAPGEVILEYRRLLHEQEKRWFDTEIARSRERKQRAPAAPDGRAGVMGAVGVVGRGSFGDLDVEVVGVEVVGPDDQPASYFCPGDRVRVRVRAIVHKAMTRLNVAVRIRNKQGVKMYSWGTLNQDIAVWAGRAQEPVFWDRAFRAGESVTVEFDFDCRLGADLYEVQAVVSEEVDRFYNQQRILHWRDEAAFFQVGVRRQEYFFGGACDLQMRARVVD